MVSPTPSNLPNQLILSKFRFFNISLLDLVPDPHIEYGSGSKRDNECGSRSTALLFILIRAIKWNPERGIRLWVRIRKGKFLAWQEPTGIKVKVSQDFHSLIAYLPTVQVSEPGPGVQQTVSHKAGGLRQVRSDRQLCGQRRRAPD